MNILVVGAGISGLTAARLLAEKDHNITVIEKRSHIGGNCYDYMDENRILIHKYGTHIFHTDDHKAWNFLSKFTKWFPYQHKVLALIDGMEVPIPFNLNSIHQVFPNAVALKLESKLLENFGFNVKVPILELRKTGDKDLLFLANYIYEKVFLNYTLKQWGVSPEELNPGVTGRVPVYISRDNRYFQNKYQGIPLDGYTNLFEKMINHPNIKVFTNVTFHKGMLEDFDRVIYTGPIDEFHDYKLGELPYRSLRFDFLKFNREYFQKNSVVNYPNNYDFTRIGEYKYFLDTRSPATVVSYEYPEPFVNGKNDRYYPVTNDATAILYQRYVEISEKFPNICFVGRLGDYKYYDMDKAVSRVLDLVNTKFN